MGRIPGISHLRAIRALQKAGFQVVREGKHIVMSNGSRRRWRLQLARISHKLSTAAADPGMSTALRSVGLLDVLSSTPAGPSVARLVSTPVCAASLRNLVRNAGQDEGGS